eukprot:TRINITY_DN41376_c0_g1_i1.p1 TRINITY_DN41376_c0_g1~~TRINITY_DN41376_c0_g1_i1.p1  ORF type:complete len:523 (+),score=51.05 TRINITY_DN41376_c0_g1_i1:41-1570(+)
MAAIPTTEGTLAAPLVEPELEPTHGGSSSSSQVQPADSEGQPLTETVPVSSGEEPGCVTTAAENGARDVEAAAPPATERPPRLEALDAPRWIASIMIVCEHFFRESLGPLASWGGVWTQFFFVLSGFVLAYVEMARPLKKASKMSQLQYLRKRLITIYPLYMFTLCLCLFQFRHSKMAWKTLPFSILLMHAWIPLTWEGGTCSDDTCWGDWYDWCMVSNQWVGTSWFLSVLVIYWLLLRPVTACVRSLSYGACVTMIFICWFFSGCVASTAFTFEPNTRREMVVSSVIVFGPLGYLHVFVAGILAARVFILSCTKDAVSGEPPCASTERLVLDKRRAPLLFRFGCVAGYALYACLVYVWPDVQDDDGDGGSVGRFKYWVMHNGGMLPVMLLILVGGACGADPLAQYLFRTSLFQVLGRISYAQYLLQFNVHEMVTRDVPTDDQALMDWLTVGALLLTSWFAERYVSRIYTDWQRSRQEKGEEGWDDRLIRVVDACRARVRARVCALFRR